MEIVENNNAFEVVQNSEILYVALTMDEAQGFIDWKNRPDAGNTDECLTC